MTIASSGTPYVLGTNEGEELWFLGSHSALKVTGAQTAGGLTVVESGAVGVRDLHFTIATAQ